MYFGYFVTVNGTLPRATHQIEHGRLLARYFAEMYGDDLRNYVFAQDEVERYPQYRYANGIYVFTDRKELLDGAEREP